MKTYQDLVYVREKNMDILEFIKSAISEYKSSDMYKNAVTAQKYYDKQNVTIIEYKRLLYTLEGNLREDTTYSANYKLVSGWFSLFADEQNQYLLSNGTHWKNENTPDKLGTPTKQFDTQLQDAGIMAIIGGVSYGFWNLDHIDVFGASEFVPLEDEEDGALKAGIRFWQIAENRPIRATLYELDGYTEYIWGRKQRGDRIDFEAEGEILNDKRAYKLFVNTSDADGKEIYGGENYPSFPIVPLFANKSKQSEIIGIREQIDCYDLIRSGYANNVDDASIIYWLIQNAGGMDDIDLRKFLDRIKTVHGAVVDEDGATAEAHTMDAPYMSREALLARLRDDMFRDFMAADVDKVAAGNVTATQIKASFFLLNMKCNKYEFQVLKFVNAILSLAGIKDETPTFTRDTLINTSEEINAVLSAAQYLSEEYITEKVLTLLGDGDMAEDMIDKIAEENMEKFETLVQANAQAKQNQEESEGAEVPQTVEET